MIKAYTSKYLAPLVVGTAMTVSSFSGLELRAQETSNVQREEKQKIDMSRYRKHEGTWWYEIEHNRWLYWDGDEWKKPKNIAPFPPKPPKGFEKKSLRTPYQEITPEKEIYIRKIIELGSKLYTHELSREEYEREKKKLFAEYNIGPEEQHLNDINNEVIIPLTLQILKVIFSKSGN